MQLDKLLLQPDHPKAKNRTLDKKKKQTNEGTF